MSEENAEVLPENEAIETDEIETEEVEGEESSEEVEASGEEVQAETEEELAEELQEAADNGASDQELKDMVKTFQLKVNGKTYNKQIDLSDEEAVKRELQKAMAGQQSMQEAAELRKLFENEIKRLQEDPEAVLEELGIDLLGLSEKRIQKEIEERQKSPEQIEREKIQKELEEARRLLKEQQEKSQQSEMQRLQEQAASQLDEEINSALDAHSLPASPMVVKRIADTMLWALDQGFDDISVDDVIPTVEKEIQDEMSKFASDLPLELFQKYIGKQNLERMREDRIKKMKNTPASKKKLNETSKGKKSEPSRKKVKLEDWMRGY